MPRCAAVAFWLFMGLLLSARLSAQRRYALLIASGEHVPDKVKLPPLLAPPNDLRLMASLLDWRYGFPPDQILLLGSDPNIFPVGAKYRFYAPHATGKAIQSALSALRQQVRPEDYVVVYFSGHTLPPVEDPFASNFQTEYLVAYDGQIKDRLFRDWVRRLPSRHVTLIMDACYSGELAEKAPISGTADGVHFRLVPKTQAVQTDVPDAPLLSDGEAENKEAEKGGPVPPATQTFLAACAANEKTWEVHFYTNQRETNQKETNQKETNQKEESMAISGFTWALYHTLVRQTVLLPLPSILHKIEAYLKRLKCDNQHPVVTPAAGASLIAPLPWQSDRPRFRVRYKAADLPVLEGGFFAGVEPGRSLRLYSLEKSSEKINEKPKTQLGTVGRRGWFDAALLSHEGGPLLAGTEWVEEVNE